MPVVIPDVMVTIHCVPAVSKVDAAVNVKVAVEVPEKVAAAVKAVEPQDDSCGAANVPNVNVGSVRDTVSAMSKGEFIEKVNASSVSAAVSGFSICNVLCVNTGVGTETAIEMGMGTSLRSVDNASDADTFRVDSSSLCATLLLVTPDGIKTVHSVPAFRVSPAAVKVTLAAPEVALKVVEPHPVVSTPDMVSIEKVGSCRVISSLMASGVFKENEYASDAGLDTTLWAKVKLDSRNAVAVTALDSKIAVAAISVPPPLFSATVRVDRSPA